MKNKQLITLKFHRNTLFRFHIPQQLKYVHGPFVHLCILIENLVKSTDLATIPKYKYWISGYFYTWRRKVLQCVITKYHEFKSTPFASPRSARRNGWWTVYLPNPHAYHARRAYFHPFTVYVCNVHTNSLCIPTMYTRVIRGISLKLPYKPRAARGHNGHIPYSAYAQL